MGDWPGTLEGLVMITNHVQAEFWHNRSVFITGHTGFKGSWLSLWLHKLSARLTGYALDPATTPSLYEVCKIKELLVNDIRADIRDYACLLSSMQAAKPEVVLHLAAQAMVRDGYRDPVATFATNVMGTVHVLDAARHCPSVRAVVIITSDKCYENREWPWGYRENDPMGGIDPYSASKGCAELVTASYQRAFTGQTPELLTSGPIASARAGNVIGGGDWSQGRLIPDILAAVHEQKPLRLRYPEAVRPWQHVLEPLSGYLLLSQTLWERGHAMTGAWNFGPHDHDVVSVRSVVDALIQRMNHNHLPMQHTQTPAHEAGQLKLDSSKAKSQLGWLPRWTIGQALDKVVAWDQVWRSGASMQEFSLSQIQEYMNNDKKLQAEL